MAGYTTNKRTNHQIVKGTGFVRAGQVGQRHRFDLRQAPASDPAAPATEFPSQDPNLEEDLDHTLGDNGPEGVDSDVNEVHVPGAAHIHTHAPTAIHIHLSPTDHAAFKGMARKRR